MPTVVQRRRSPIITGRKLARQASRRVKAVYGFDPREGTRSAVAEFSASVSAQLSDIAQTLRESPSSSLTVRISRLGLHELLDFSRNQSLAGMIAVQRIASPGRGDYPLKHTHYVTLNYDRDRVIAEIREVSRKLDLRGEGFDPQIALDNLFLRFTQLVERKVRIAPHEMRPEDAGIVATVNHMVDWERWRKENQPPHPLWGRILKSEERAVEVQWLIGPDGSRDSQSVIERGDILARPALFRISPGHWFHAVIQRDLETVLWIEEPHEIPDPTDPQARQEAWQAIPAVYADQPDVWPTKDDTAH